MLLALTTTTKSPRSMCSANVGRCLPRRNVAIWVARRPSVWPSASTRRQACVTSLAFGLYVFCVFAMIFPEPQGVQLVVDTVKRQANGGRVWAGRATIGTRKRRRETVSRPAAIAHPQQAADNRAHHLLEEGVGADLENVE